MRKSLWIVFAILFVAIGTPAFADSYTYTFVGGPDALAGTNFTLVNPAGPLSFSATTNLAPLLTSATDFMYDGKDWGPIDWVLIRTYPSNGLPFLVVGAIYTSGITFGNFLPTMTDLSAPGTYNYVDTPATLVYGTMTISSTPVATPEPGSLALMLAGIGFLLVMVKRLA